MPTAKKVRKAPDPDEMRAEYDFSNAIRGKYAGRFAKSTNVVVLAPDVAETFKTARAVNTALRSQLAKKPAQKAGSRLTRPSSLTKPRG
jgi:hypothetical protein